MEERLKSLEGITLEEWGLLQTVINNNFEKAKLKSTFVVTKDTLKEMERINRLIQVTVR